MGLVNVRLVSPDLLWESCTYSHCGGENPWILLFFILSFVSMLGWLISPPTSVCRFVWISPLMANAAGVTESKLSPLSLFLFHFSSRSFFTHLVGLWLVSTVSRLPVAQTRHSAACWRGLCHRVQECLVFSGYFISAQTMLLKSHFLQIKCWFPSAPQTHSSLTF